LRVVRQIWAHNPHNPPSEPRDAIVGHRHAGPVLTFFIDAVRMRSQPRTARVRGRPVRSPCQLAMRALESDI
jgi:hypothetical protein